MKLIISKNRHKVYKDFSSIGYLGECNSRTIYVTQPKVDDADSYCLRLTYSDNVTIDVPIVDNKILITASLLREVGEIECQWIASKSNGTTYDLIAKSQVFNLQIERSICDETISIPPVDYTINTYDKIKTTKEEIEAIAQEVNDKVQSIYENVELNVLSNLDFANRYYIEEAQANTPFANENYEYITPVEATIGIYSEPFLLPNGKYRIVVTSKNSPSNMEIAIYNPSFGCYYYDTDKDSIAFDWIKQDDKYICDFEIKTDYEQNYVMLGDPSRNMDRWNGLNVKLYRYNQSENMATKKELNNLSNNVAVNTESIAQNSSDISAANDDIRNCHYFYTTVASPANIDTTNHKITIERLVVLTMRGPSIWLDNVDLTYDTSWWIACVYFDYDETDDSKKLKICQHSDLPQKNIDVVMSFPARGAEFAKYAYAKFTFTVDGKNL